MVRTVKDGGGVLSDYQWWSCDFCREGINDLPYALEYAGSVDLKTSQWRFWSLMFSNQGRWREEDVLFEVDLLLRLSFVTL
jgi:hypothetical protein